MPSELELKNAEKVLDMLNRSRVSLLSKCAVMSLRSLSMTPVWT